MSAWGYVAIDRNGKEIKGSKDAETEEQVRRELKNQGFIVLEVTEQNFLTRDIELEYSGDGGRADYGRCAGRSLQSGGRSLIRKVRKAQRAAGISFLRPRIWKCFMQN